MATPLAVAGEAMETLKMKIFMLKKENNEVTEKMEEAEKVGIASFLLWFVVIIFHFLFIQEKSEANDRLKEAEKKIKELSKQIHTR